MNNKKLKNLPISALLAKLRTAVIAGRDKQAETIRRAIRAASADSK